MSLVIKIQTNLSLYLQVTYHVNCLVAEQKDKTDGPYHTLTLLLAFLEHCFWLTKPFKLFSLVITQSTTSLCLSMCVRDTHRQTHNRICKWLNWTGSLVGIQGGVCWVNHRQLSFIWGRWVVGCFWGVNGFICKWVTDSQTWSTVHPEWVNGIYSAG